MEDNDMRMLWKSYDKRLEESLTLNRRNAEAITRMQVRSLIASMKPTKMLAVLVGLVWVALVDGLLIVLPATASPFFLVSAGIQVLLTKLAIGIYLYQLVLIHQVDSHQPVLVTQEKIARLKSSTIWVARFLLLQLPVWTTFYWSERMFETGTPFVLLIQVLVTGGFTYLAVWLFYNIRYENRHKKWFGWLFGGNEWSPMMKSMDLLNQVNDYKQEMW
ncbi:hypothetical protein GCM10027341_33610 [Spirosoma knui]